MTNKEISKIISLTGKLMELHDENPFKVKSYQNAAFKIGRLDKQLIGLSIEELERIDGVGKTLSAKIFSLLTTGKIDTLEEMLLKTPQGVVEMMGIKGIGPKKIKTLWHELGVENPGELLYACNENRLVELKGFGAKTQAEVKKGIEFIFSSKGKFLYASVEQFATGLIEQIKNRKEVTEASFTGKMRRKCEIIEEIEIVVASETEEIISTLNEIVSKNEDIRVPVKFIYTKPEHFCETLFKTTATESHLHSINVYIGKTEEEIYSANNLPFITPEMREGIFEFEWIKKYNEKDLIELSDLKGILHNHTNWSDGANTLEEMANYCKELGYSYLGICDHSKSAFYANGLQAERVLAQQKQIDELNLKLAPFHIFKGIESDILNDGSLDYDDEILKTFDFIVASVHSNLKMNEEQATSRLIKAIENKYTTILGHPTGRLLLSRAGYPINHKKVIDACAANNVVIELNANPHRLDIDWRWIQYANEKNVMISINPDAHYREGYHDMYFGVCVARKGGLVKNKTFNALSLEEISNWFNGRKQFAT